MKIMLVIPTIAQGGAERVMSELANIWASQDYEVHLVLLADAEQFYALEKSVIVHNLGFPLHQNKFIRLFSLAKTFFKLRRLISQQESDFVLSFMNKYNVFTLLSTFGLKKKIIVSERDSPTEKLHFITNFLRKYTYGLAHGIITQTQLSKKFIEDETGNKNVISIPNPLKSISDDNEVNKEKIILNVGRLVTKKGQDYLLEAFYKLNLDDWKLVLLGDGHLKQKLEKKVQKLGIEEKVIMPGAVKNVDKWLLKSSIFAFPSLLEGFPNALAEAMAAGLPCVSFNCDTGPSDLIEDGINGYLVNTGDIDTFTTRLYELATNVKLRDQLALEAKKVAFKLDRKKIANDYYEFCIH